MLTTRRDLSLNPKAGKNKKIIVYVSTTRRNLAELEGGNKKTKNKIIDNKEEEEISLNWKARTSNSPTPTSEF